MGGPDIRRFDIYRKVPKDLTQPTTTGAIVSLTCCVFILYLFVAEFRAYLTPEISTTLNVQDPVEYAQRIPVSLVALLHNMPCEYVGLDIQDQTGRHDVGFVENVKKDSYGPEGPKEDGDACLLQATFHINKVPGNFHLSTHAYGKPVEGRDMTHTIHSVTFGHSAYALREYKLEGSFDPLHSRSSENGSTLIHEYVVKVVPTVMELPGGAFIYPYQYTYAYRTMNAADFGSTDTSIWFRYDLSPITVQYKVKSKPLYHFLTTICAILGGTFTVAGIIDGLIFSASEMVRKLEIGKLH